MIAHIASKFSLPAEGGGSSEKSETGSQPKTICDFTAKDIDGKESNLEKYRGHVCVIVNVASK